MVGRLCISRGCLCRAAPFSTQGEPALVTSYHPKLQMPTYPRTREDKNKREIYSDNPPNYQLLFPPSACCEMMKVGFVSLSMLLLLLLFLAQWVFGLLRVSCCRLRVAPLDSVGHLSILYCCWFHLSFLSELWFWSRLGEIDSPTLSLTPSLCLVCEHSSTLFPHRALVWQSLELPAVHSSSGWLVVVSLPQVAWLSLTLCQCSHLW